ncbi:PREDICTED: uncharacterized protein LOC108771627 [Cyphomyrmex costatus]|uniref:uncharacterized protein LOC108771627 n=1 Tax=Cyphomyrmex costatus TaxID=456900 RepID=UPI00085244B1|nr:PREDICTED: uncharacterized protein LOC108771627 [Cyphomyrmex costatus]
MNVTSKQKEMLLTLLKANPELVRGRMNRKSESRRKLAEGWDEIANNINAHAVGPKKNGKEWAKTWKDIKSYILKKEAKRRNYMQGTGGGPSINISFTNFEEEVIEFLTPEAAGLEGIPEGGINLTLNEKDQEVEEINVQTVEENTEIDMEINENAENISTNISIPEQNMCEQRQKQNSFLKRFDARKGISMHQLSCDMLQIQ